MQIQVLDKSVSELIAAGEVIERPASVVKELIENAIDAGASSITVEIKNGGVTFMRISDNGSGIPHNQCPTAFLRHATSKVRVSEDLDCISTMGFRGEALASVSAVGRVSLLSKMSDGEIGTSYKIEGGIELEHELAGCPDGTTIIIRDLFFNTPARLKFLKKDVTEGNYVQSVVDKAALINPQIAFRFIRDNNLVRVTPGDGKLYSAIYAVYGKNHAVSMIEVDCSQNGVSVNGYVSKPLFCRNNRTFQNFYVNSRYIRSSTCVAALEEAYRNSIMSGKFPACVLNISLNPADVDANVHPAKTEVRFVNDRAIFSAVHMAVRNALLNESSPVPEQRQPVKEYAEPVQSAETLSGIEIPTVTVALDSEKSEYIPTSPQPTTPQPVKLDAEFKHLSSDSFVKREKPVIQLINRSVLAENKCEQYRVIGELFMNYILCERNQELILIDKHAADERIRFEKLKSELRGHSQLLIEPIEVAVDLEGADSADESELERIGLKIEVVGFGLVRVTAMPTLLDVSQIEELLSEVAQKRKHGGSVTLGDLSVVDEVLHRIACRSAIKAGDKSTALDIEQLAERVLAGDSELRYCPHGRPITVKITKAELEKKFKRIL
jgi:DNA mismatch repair protein MutL